MIPAGECDDGAITRYLREVNLRYDRLLDYEGKFLGVTGIGLTVDSVRKLVAD